MSSKNYFQTLSSIPSDLYFDAILVLGGGVPEDILNPPSYTKERCKAASQIYHNVTSNFPNPPKILTLSAGTAHLPQALSSDGLPIWESTASAAYLIHHLRVNPEDVYAETTSYDTISNAFFARLNFCDIAQWKKLLVITNEFHMERTKLIFNWIFFAPMMEKEGSKNNDEGGYDLYYYTVPDVGLTESAIQARKVKEQKSVRTIKNILSQRYTTIEQIFEFLTKEHSFYTASKLVERGMDDGSNTNADAVGKLVQDSYGGISIRKSRKVGVWNEVDSISASFLVGTFFGFQDKLRHPAPSILYELGLPEIVHYILKLFILLLGPTLIGSCKIHGTESGVCAYRYLPSFYQDGIRTEREAIDMSNLNWANGTDGVCKDGEGDHCMPFCGRYIAHYYPPCVPNAGVALERDKNFPVGRFHRHNTREKDRWVEEQVTSIIEKQVDLEAKKKAKKRFYKNKTCQDAYKRYFCWLNFPRCDEFGETLPMCQSTCENFFRACGYDEKMWICNHLIENKFQYEEIYQENDSYFPGEPFKKNEYHSKNIPKEICTPSIRGDASQISLVMPLAMTAALVIVQMVIL